jgi:hypothetical protein
VSLTNGLVHPGDKFLNVEPTRVWNFSQAGGPLVTYTALESYSAGEVVWPGSLGTNTIRILKKNIAIGETYQYDFTQPPFTPFNLAVPYIDIVLNAKNVNAYNNIMGPDWNRLSLAASFIPYNNVELIRKNVGNDFGSVVYNKPIPNDWRTLTIRAQTSIAGDADVLYFGLLTDPALINNSASSLYATTGLFRYTDIWGNTAGWGKTTGGVLNFNQNVSATSDKTGRLNSSAITFQREAFGSESIRVTGSLNGVNFTSNYQANALPITGQSYLIIGAQSGTFNATMTTGHISYAITKA